MIVNGPHGDKYKVAICELGENFMATFTPLDSGVNPGFEIEVKKEHLASYIHHLRIYGTEPRTRKMEN